MSRNISNTTEHTTKRSFRVDTASLSAEKPLLDTGYYAGQLTQSGVTFTNADNTETFHSLSVQRKRTWNNRAKKWDFSATDYEIAGSFAYNAVLLSAKAKKVLGVDEPKVFRGRIYLTFEEDCSLDVANNTVFKNFLVALGLEDEAFDEAVDYEWDENIVTRDNAEALMSFSSQDIEAEQKDDEINGVILHQNAEELLNWCVFYRKYFSLVAECVNTKMAKIKVIKAPTSKNKSTPINIIGSDSSFCGILPYVDGCEFDLPED